MWKGSEKGLERGWRMKVGIAFGTRIKSTGEVVGLRARGQLASCLPDLLGLPQTLWPEAGMQVFPVAAQVHKNISVYWWQRSHEYW